MTAPQDVQNLIGRTVIGSDGDKIGKVEQVYLNDESGQPEWITVSGGLFSKDAFVPLHGATDSGSDLQVAVTKGVVKDAPGVKDDGHTDEAEQNALYDYYAAHLGWDTGQQTADQSSYQDSPTYADSSDGAQYAGDTREDLSGQPGIEGQDTSGPTTDDAMTRSEERLHVGTEKVQTGRARLRKYIVEENVSTTVPVSHEEVTIEREPITEANVGDATAGADLSEEEHEVTLHAERPVVSKETVPVERVRLGTETVTEDAQVDETVRKEQIDTPETVTDTDADTSGR